MKIAKYGSKIEFKIEQEAKLDMELILKEKYNMSMSDYMRQCVYDFIKKEKKGDKKNV